MLEKVTFTDDNDNVLTLQKVEDKKNFVATFLPNEYNDNQFWYFHQNKENSEYGFIGSTQTSILNVLSIDEFETTEEIIRLK